MMGPPTFANVVAFLKKRNVGVSPVSEFRKFRK
jgi:hypothetical protein